MLLVDGLGGGGRVGGQGSEIKIWIKCKWCIVIGK